MLRVVVWGTFATLLIAGGATSATGNAPKVAVVPTRTIDAPFHRARRIDRAMRSALDRSALSPRVLQRRLLGRDLGEQAEACAYDVLCLAELGELLQADLLLLGSVRLDEDEDLRLQLQAIDVAGATLWETLDWRMSPEEMDAAAGAAARWLSLPADARIVLENAPPDVKVFVYDEVLPGAAPTGFGFWSGRFRVRFEAPGFVPVEQVLAVRPGENVVDASMDPDLLYTARDPEKVEVFDGEGRRLGSGRGAMEAGALRPVEKRSKTWLKVGLWSGVAVLSAVAITGGIVMASAQSRYNDVADEVRFDASTTSALQAAQIRADGNDEVTVGSAMLVGAGTLAVGGLVWALVETF